MGNKVKIFDGKKLALEKEKALRKKVAQLKKKPKLVIIFIGENKASEIYVRKKRETGERLGIEVEAARFKESDNGGRIKDFIRFKNRDSTVNGLMIQWPVPKKFDFLELATLISPLKDVDCLTPENLGLLFLGKSRFLPATVKAVKFALEDWGGVLAGKDVVVVGASTIVGRPLACWLCNERATVTICRRTTKTLSNYTKTADIVISATGQRNLLKGEMIKKGAVVIDIGIDAEFSSVVKKASFLTPVPGGIGPLTVISLLENVIISCLWQKM